MFRFRRLSLPFGAAFRKMAEVIGFDIEKKVGELKWKYDATGELISGALTAPHIEYTLGPRVYREHYFPFVTVPKPYDESRKPDLDL